MLGGLKNLCRIRKCDRLFEKARAHQIELSLQVLLPRELRRRELLDDLPLERPFASGTLRPLAHPHLRVQRAALGDRISPLDAAHSGSYALRQMPSEYVRRYAAQPVPPVASAEVGLAALRPLAELAQKSCPAKATVALGMVRGRAACFAEGRI